MYTFLDWMLHGHPVVLFELKEPLPFRSLPFQPNSALGSAQLTQHQREQLDTITPTQREREIYTDHINE